MSSLDTRIAEMTTRGWQIVHRSPEGAQLRKPRQINTLGVLLFVLLPALVGCFWWYALGIALIGVIIVAADYLTKRDELIYLSATAPQPATTAPMVVRNEQGQYVCSKCNGFVRADAGKCKHCDARFVGN